MGDRYQARRNDDNRSDESPPYSRVFVVCDKKITPDDLRGPFEAMGNIESITMPRDRVTGESKGIAFIKYAKTSSAAAAIREYHNKVIGSLSRPVRVMLACNRHESNLNIDEGKYRRLFIIVHKDTNESDIREHFSKFGEVGKVMFQQSKNNNQNDNQRFAYVNFHSFYDTAVAFEECDRKYKPIFAIPREHLKRERSNHEDYGHRDGFSRDHRDRHDSHPSRGIPEQVPHHQVTPRYQPQVCSKVIAVITPSLPQKYVESVFNIIPGMERFQFSNDSYSSCRAFISYNNPKSALLACERINHFEFPSGEVITVKLDNDPIGNAANDLKTIVENFKTAIDSGRGPDDLVHLADAIAQASTLIKAAATGSSDSRDTFDPNYCSVRLPPIQPTAQNAQTVERCFVVCKPYPPSPHVLIDIFRRFGDLVDIRMIPEKNYGFAKFASSSSAQEAMRVLNGATVCGNLLKVVEAVDPNEHKRTRMEVDNSV